MTFEKFKKYGGTIHLTGLLKIVTSNRMIADKLTQAGFTNVDVQGTGEIRNASGVWSRETNEVNLESTLPKGIKVEIHAL